MSTLVIVGLVVVCAAVVAAVWVGLSRRARRRRLLQPYGDAVPRTATAAMSERRRALAAAVADVSRAVGTHPELDERWWGDACGALQRGYREDPLASRRAAADFCDRLRSLLERAVGTSAEKDLRLALASAERILELPTPRSAPAWSATTEARM